MSRHVYSTLLRNNFRKLCFSSSSISFNNSSPFTVSNSHHIPKAPALPDNIKVPKHLEPVMNKSVGSILSSVTDLTSVYEAVILLKALRMQTMFTHVDSKHFRNDPKFKLLCNIFGADCYKLLPAALIAGWRSLLEFGVPPNSQCIQNAENSIINSKYRFSILNLIGCLYHHHKFIETDLQKRVVSILMFDLQKRIGEVSSPSEILMLIHIYLLFDKEFKTQIDAKIIGILPLFKTQELCKFISVMADKSNRNIAILNAISTQFCQTQDKPNLKDAIDICYACKKLNFFDPKLFSHILNHFEDEIKFVEQASVITGLLTACGHMRWRHEGILDACSAWILNHIQECKTKDFVSFVLTLSSLNYVPSHVQNTVNQIVPKLSKEDIKSPDAFLDVAWSLGVLDCIPKQMLLQVLSKSFNGSLKDPKYAAGAASNTLKILNLKGILKMKHPECVFGCDLFLEPIKLQESSTIENSKAHVLNVLSNFVRGDKFLCTSQSTEMGVLIDAEFVINEKLKSLPLNEYGILSKEITSLKPMPKDFKRISLIILFPKDYTEQSVVLTGMNALGMRLLKHVGYTVVTVSYEEFSKNKTELSKVKYLSDLVKQAIKVES